MFFNIKLFINRVAPKPIKERIPAFLVFLKIKRIKDNNIQKYPLSPIKFMNLKKVLKN